MAEDEWEKVESWRFWDASKRRQAVVALARAFGLERVPECNDGLKSTDLVRNILIRETYLFGGVAKVEVIVTRGKHRVTVTLSAKKGYRMKIHLPDIERICR